ncbi:hypothetical protein [Cryobacterium sp.]|uniref:hypothetical protein n=1 Tax=Cryobacterium sp. TaxID=1926290 RepID=UPI00262AE636|nr:hypothetical protein [Cryobacterium sp.]
MRSTARTGPGERSTRLERRTARLLTWIVLVGAVAWGLLATAYGIVTVVGQLLRDRFTVELLAQTPLPDAASAGSARLTSGTFDSAEVTIAGLSALPRFLLTLQGSTALATTLLISATVGYFCLSVLRRRPFTKPVFQLVAVVGYALIIGTVLGQGFGGLGGMIAAGELNRDPADGFWPMATLVDLGPAATGLVLLVAAAAIHLGQRLQDDTDGLV